MPFLFVCRHIDSACNSTVSTIKSKPRDPRATSAPEQRVPSLLIRSRYLQQPLNSCHGQSTPCVTWRYWLVSDAPILIRMPACPTICVQGLLIPYFNLDHADEANGEAITSGTKSRTGAKLQSGGVKEGVSGVRLGRAYLCCLRDLSRCREPTEVMN